MTEYSSSARNRFFRRKPISKGEESIPLNAVEKYSRNHDSMADRYEERIEAAQLNVSEEQHLGVSGRSKDSHTDASRQQRDPRSSLPEGAAGASEDDRRWAENWRVREIKYLSSRVEDLERQLRRKTLFLVSVLVLAGLLAATAATFGVAPLHGPEPPPAGRNAALVHQAPPGPPLTAEAERTEQTIAAVGLDGSGGLEAREQTGGEDPMTAGHADERAATGYENGDAALRAALAAARERIAELEAAGARYEGTIAELHTELDGTRAEARALGEQVEVSRRGIEELNAMLAGMMGGDGRRADEEGRQAGPREAGGAEPAPAEATVRAFPAEDGGDGAQASDAPSYAAVHPVNLRAAPTNEAEVLAVVERGEVVRRVGEQGGWLQVEYRGRPGRDVTGWVYNTHLRRVETLPEGSGPPARADD